MPNHIFFLGRRKVEFNENKNKNTKKMKMNKMKHERIKINNIMKTKQNNQIKK